MPSENDSNITRTASTSTTDSSIVDRWLRKDWAYSTTIVGIHGDTARKAVNKLDDEDRMVHLEVDEQDIDRFDRIDREEVPGWARDPIENEHENRVQTIEKAVGGQ